MPESRASAHTGAVYWLRVTVLGTGFQQFPILAASRDPWWMRRARPPCRVPGTERRALSTLQRSRFCRVDKRSASTIGLAADTLLAALADLPDGLENLTAHNVLSFKSKQEALDGWAMEELVGHYVTYRKLASIQARTGPPANEPSPNPEPSPAAERLLPEAAFRLYAVATRHPTKLFGQLAPGAQHPTDWPGVYDLDWGSRRIRVIVLNALAKHPRNAPWELFASRLDRIRYGLAHYRPRNPDAHLLRFHLAKIHQLELPDMAYTLEDFKLETYRMLIDDFHALSLEDRQALLERMDVADRLRGLDTEEILRRLDPEEILGRLDPEQVKAWLKRTGH
jgi:hypothetical protein